MEFLLDPNIWAGFITLVERNYAHFPQHKVYMDPSPKRLSLTSTPFYLFAVSPVPLTIDPVPAQATWRAQ